MEILLFLFGELGSLEYALHHLFFRTFFIYVVTICIVRLGNKRFIGEHTAFDFIIAVMLGSIMSRIIIQDFTFLNGMVVAVFLVFFHSLFATISIYSDWFGNLVKGRKTLLVENGEIFEKNLRNVGLSKQDLLSALRRDGHTENVSQVRRAYLERNGKVSVLKQDGS